MRSVTSIRHSWNLWMDGKPQGRVRSTNPRQQETYVCQENQNAEDKLDPVSLACCDSAALVCCHTSSPHLQAAGEETAVSLQLLLRLPEVPTSLRATRRCDSRGHHMSLTTEQRRHLTQPAVRGALLGQFTTTYSNNCWRWPQNRNGTFLKCFYSWRFLCECFG